MANPLVTSCAVIARSGYSGQTLIDPPWVSKKLLDLGEFILNHSNLGKVFKLSVPKRKNYGVPGTIALGFGAGIDSYCALHYALTQGHKVVVVQVDYGQPYYLQEKKVFDRLKLAWAQTFDRAELVYTDPFYTDLSRLRDAGSIQFQDVEFAEAHEPLVPAEADFDFGWENYIIPARNLVLAAICSEYAPTIWIVANKRKDSSVGTPDKSPKFYRETSAVFTEFYGYQHKVESPFLHLSKLETVREYFDRGGTQKALLSTFSCYTPNHESKLQCGTCLACYKRYKLFQALNIEVDFDKHPATSVHRNEFEEYERRKRG